MRSDYLNKDYWEKLCRDLFGIFTDTKEINIHLGADKIAVSNVYFTNGHEDGWIWAGI